MALNRPLLVEVAPGELIDKLTILSIKQERIEDSAMLANVEIEHQKLLATYQEQGAWPAEIASLTAQLKEVNQQLWDIEDAIRRCEQAKDFGETFVQLARSVYINNDTRAKLKRQINDLLGSEIVEEKQYVDYQADPTEPPSSSAEA